MTEQISIYRERAHLVAHLAALYPSALVHGADAENPGWPLIFIDTPRGQLSWHLAVEDLDLFAHVPELAGDQAPTWDGHTTPQKYQRLASLTADMADPDKPSLHEELRFERKARNGGIVNGRQDRP
ncbi:hypothetical protein MF672_010790 [Actinomadura sp. ATCC 31491]|uniref:WDGH domain-containing protein n=1 Tax=Actinomadura luzonensis TaxID=2805427 RepID=A0ABT0FQS6_9ACTN|nr:hypothetical protein [Actinomadura luzonensis]MCK2214273.1 hypothetical protein [Actinomadura luzonensis]